MKYFGKYRIYRAITNGNLPTSFTFFTEIAAYSGTTQVNSWIDESIETWGGNHKVWYKISAVDNSLLESQLSDYDWVRCGWVPKESNAKNFSFILYQNYPNPFNPSTSISFYLKEMSYVVISVYNCMGEKIQTLIENNYNEGEHSVTLNAENFSSGIYFYSIIATNNKNEVFSSTRKMLLMK